MEQHLNIIQFDLSNRQFQFRPHYEKDIYIMTGTVSPNGKLIAYAVHTKDDATFHEKYVILIKNILEDYIHSVIYSNYLIDEIYDFSFVKCLINSCLLEPKVVPASGKISELLPKSILPLKSAKLLIFCKSGL